MDYTVVVERLLDVSTVQIQRHPLDLTGKGALTNWLTLSFAARVEKSRTSCRHNESRCLVCENPLNRNLHMDTFHTFPLFDGEGRWAGEASASPKTIGNHAHHEERTDFVEMAEYRVKRFPGHVPGADALKPGHLAREHVSEFLSNSDYGMPGNWPRMIVMPVEVVRREWSVNSQVEIWWDGERLSDKF